MSKENRVSAEDRLRLYVTDPETFEFSFEDADALVEEIDALRSKPVAGVVKPLEWEQHSEELDGMVSNARWYWSAKDPLGGYAVIRVHTEDFEGECSWANRTFPTAQEAKADYEDHRAQRVLACINLLTAEQEPVAWPRTKDWNGQYHRDQDPLGIAKCLENYADIRPAEGRLLWSMRTAAKWIRDIVALGPLYASPQPEAVITEEMVERIMSWVREDVLPAYDVTHNTRASDPEMVEGCRAALTAALKEA